MKNPLIRAGILSACLSMSASAVVNLTLVGTYDENTVRTNAVDSYATVVGDYTAFTSSVATAFTNGFGGVADFDTAEFAADTLFNLNFNGGNKTVVMTSSIAQNGTTVNLSSGTVTPISGGNVLTRPNGAVADTTFGFGQVTGAGAQTNEYVTQFGFTLLSRSAFASARTFTVTATYSDGTSTQLSSSIGTSKGTDDTFYSFIAPAGHSIQSVFVDADSNGTTTSFQPVFDDLAIITSANVIPEPSSALLIGSAALLFLRRRR